MAFFRKNKKVELAAPVSGRAVDLSETPDQVFSSKMMGEGIAFKFEGEAVCAPCDGELTLIADTLHAFGMTADNGAEILVHIGLDTVNLNGEGFTKLAEQGTKVKKGQPILKVDRDFMSRKGIDLTTPMVVVNSSEFPFKVTGIGQTAAAGKDTVILFD